MLLSTSRPTKRASSSGSAGLGILSRSDQSIAQVGSPLIGLVKQASSAFSPRAIVKRILNFARLSLLFALTDRTCSQPVTTRHGIAVCPRQTMSTDDTGHATTLPAHTANIQESGLPPACHAHYQAIASRGNQEQRGRVAPAHHRIFRCRARDSFCGTSLSPPIWR